MTGLSTISSSQILFYYATFQSGASAVTLTDLTIDGQQVKSSTASACNRWSEFISNLAVQLVRNSVTWLEVINIPHLVSEVDDAYLQSHSMFCNVSSDADEVAAALAGSATTTKNISCVDTRNNATYEWQISYCGSASTTSLTVEKTMVMAPCSACQTPVGSSDGLFLLRMNTAPKLLPPTLTNILVEPRRGSLIVNLTLSFLQSTSQSSMVACAARVTTPLSLQQLLQVASSTWTSSTSATVQVTGLTASTNYSVYCVSMSATGIYSSFRGAVSSAMSVMTACCKSVTASVLVTSAYSEQLVSSALIVSVDALPKLSLTVTLSAYLDGVLLSGEVLYPSNITFSSISPWLSTSIALADMSTSGTLVIVAKASGASATEYGASSETSPLSVPFYLDKSSFNVVSSMATLSAPSLAHAIFANNGLSISVGFSTPTDGGAYSALGAGLLSTGAWFTCSLLLSFEGDSSSSCQWTSDFQTVTVALSQSSTVVPGANLTLIGSILRAACSSSSSPSSQCGSWATAEAASVIVSAGGSPITPSVSVSGPSILGLCNDMTLDMSASTGSGGRPWNHFAFTVVSLDPASAVLSEYLNANYSMVIPSVLPFKYLSTSYSYSIVVSICNFLGSCGSSSIQFVVIANTVPTLAISGPSSQTIFRRNAYSIAAIGSVPACARSSTAATYTSSYSWSISDSSSGLSLSHASTSKNPAMFSLSAYTLSALTTYLVTVTYSATVEGAVISSSATAQVYVTRGQLIAQIAGGDVQTIRRSTVFYLSGASSYDSDQATHGNVGLSYTWTCVQLNPSVSLSCGYLVNETSRHLNTLVISSTDAFPAVSTGTSSSSRVYSSNFTLTVSDSSSRGAAATVRIYLLSAQSPLISLTSVVSNPVTVWTSLVLSASVQFPSQGGGTCEWTTTEQWFSASNSSQSAPINHVKISTELTTAQTNLVLPPFALPSGSRLVFTLACYSDIDSGSVAVGSVQVVTVSTPTPGSFAVSPTAGIELATLFSLTASSWDDAYYPLQYSFGFYDRNYGRNQFLQPRSYVAHASNALSAGSYIDSYKLSCFVTVFNSYLANTTAWKSVTVLEADWSVEQLKTMIKEAYEASTSPADLTQLLSLYTSILNRVNCSAAPNCTALNRSPCSSIAHTCGSCLSAEYVGVDGSSNEACVRMSALFTGAMDDYVLCTQDADCLPWRSCNAATSQCVAANKTCDAAVTCSGHGTCYFTDSLSGMSMSSCPQGSVQCVATCLCEDGYTGPSCGVSTSTTSYSIQSRDLLLESIVELISSQDTDGVSVPVWSTMLTAIMQNPVELAASSAVSSVAVVNSIIALAESNVVELATVTASNLLAGLGSAATGTTYLSDAAATANVTNSVVESVNYLASVLSSSMVTGQYSQSFFQSSYRLTAGITDSSSSTELALSIPLSASEIMTEAVSSSIHITAINASVGARISLVLLKDSVFDTVLGAVATNRTSSPIRLLGDMETYCSSQSSTSSYGIVFTMAHHSATPYMSSAELQAQLNETKRQNEVLARCFHGQRGFFNVSCAPGSSVSQVEYYCDGIWDLNLTVSCPVAIVYNSPACHLSLNGEYMGSDACQTLSSLPWFTTCGCNVCAARRRLSTRQLLSTSGRGAMDTVDVVAASILVSATTYASVITNPSALNSVSKVLYVIRVVMVFVILWFGIPAVWLANKFFTRMRMETKVKTSKRRNSVGTFMEAPTRENATNVLLDYASSILPAMFAAHHSVARRCWHEVSEKVPIFVIFTGSDERFKSYHFPIILFKMLTIMTYSLFALSFFFTLQYPVDDGSCGGIEDQAQCTAAKSMFDRDHSKCRWTNITSTVSNSVGLLTTETVPGCELGAPVYSPYMNILMCVLVVIVTTPIQFVLEKIFNEILLAPTSSELDGPAGSELKDPRLTAIVKAAGRAVSTARRLSVGVATQVQAAVVSAASVAGKGRRPHIYKLMHENILLPPEVIKTRFSAVMACSELPVFKKLAGSIQSEMDTDLLSGNMSAVSGNNSIHRISVRNNLSTGVNDGASNRATARQRINRGMDSRWRDFLVDLELCRKQLYRPRDLEAFDEAWGVESVNANGEIVLFAYSKEAIRKEFASAQIRGMQTLTSIQTMPRSMGGAELMKVFFADMVGGSSNKAQILRATVSEAVLAKKRVVTWSMKCCVIAALILVNLFFIYSCLLYAANRDLRWQFSWITNVIINIAVEMIVGPCFEVCVLDCLVPGSIAASVEGAKVEVARQVKRLCERSDTNTLTDRGFPDIQSKYFFASRVVANNRPDLMESSLVHGFETKFPFMNDHLRLRIQEYNHWHKHQNRQGTNGSGISSRSLCCIGSTRSREDHDLGRRWRLNSAGVTLLFVFLLRQLGMLPLSAQKFIMQILQPLYVAVVGFGFAYLIQHIGLAWTVLLFALTVFLLCTALGYLLKALFTAANVSGPVAPGKSQAGNSKRGVVAPLQTETDDDREMFISAIDHILPAVAAPVSKSASPKSIGKKKLRTAEQASVDKPSSSDSASYNHRPGKQQYPQYLRPPPLQLTRKQVGSSKSSPRDNSDVRERKEKSASSLHSSVQSSEANHSHRDSEDKAGTPTAELRGRTRSVSFEDLQSRYSPKHGKPDHNKSTASNGSSGKRSPREQGDIKHQPDERVIITKSPHKLSPRTLSRSPTADPLKASPRSAPRSRTSTVDESDGWSNLGADEKEPTTAENCVGIQSDADDDDNDGEINIEDDTESDRDSAEDSGTDDVSDSNDRYANDNDDSDEDEDDAYSANSGSRYTGSSRSTSSSVAQSYEHSYEYSHGDTNSEYNDEEEKEEISATSVPKRGRFTDEEEAFDYVGALNDVELDQLWMT
jgi:hypothetical protein